MARPTRQGVDYFPLDIHLDDKFKFIQIKYGLEGFAVVIKLLQKIYSYGYWYQWGEDEGLIFAHENAIELDKLDIIIQETIKRGIFHEGIYESYKVLTSVGIQKRYKEIVKRRKDVEIVTEYLLLDESFGVNTIIEPVECIHDVDIVDTECIHDVDISTQSKVDKSKVDKSILKEKISNNIDMHFMKTLLSIKNYPFDIDKDIEYLETLKERYPTLDLVQAINKFSDYILDEPFKQNAKHRSRLNDSFRMYNEWPNFKKKADISNIEEENPFARR